MKVTFTINPEVATCRTCAQPIAAGQISALMGGMRFCSAREAYLFDAVQRETKKGSDNLFAVQLAEQLRVDS